MSEIKQKVIIIGAGVSGLTAGIYCLDNGFDVEIYEKHYVPGGECAGWMRKGQYIDGCAHWIIGTTPNSELYPLWEHIGAFEGNPEIFSTDSLTNFQLKDGRWFNWHSDLNLLEKEFNAFFPEDKRAIRGFINACRAYNATTVPVNKPLDYMNWFEFLAYGIGLLPMALPFAHYKHVSIRDYVKRFKNEELRFLFQRFQEPDYNIHSFIYICSNFSRGVAGIVEGGSLPLMKRVAETFKRKGGKLFLNKPVSEVLIENNVAYGIKLGNGKEIKGDFVISSGDAHHTLNKLLGGKYRDKDFERQFKDKEANPVRSSIMLSYRTPCNMVKYPRMMDFEIDEPFDWLGQHYDHFAIRNFCFDKSLESKNGETLLTVLLPTNEDVYLNLKALSREDYLAKKQEIADIFTKLIIEKTGLKEDELELIDITSPLTYERYTNAYQGAYMSFVITNKTKGLMRPGIIKGLKNFVLAGQWLMPPGGLPCALFTGKHAAMRVCKMAKKKFINLEGKADRYLNELQIG